MEYDFETPVNRSGIGSMKDVLREETGTDPVVLAGAEMDFATAPVISRALAAFAERGIYGYTLPDTAYRSTICAWMKEVRHTEILPEEIVPTLGTIYAMCTAVRAFVREGEGVIVQHPSYYRYDVNIQNNGRRVVSNPMTETNGTYTIDFQGLEKQMADPDNKMMILCNPHNPTGKVFARQDLERIAKLAAAYDVLIFSDEIFAETCYGTHEAGLYAALDPKHGITCTSLGKAFNFTGVNQANVIIRDEGLREAYIRQRNIDHFGSIEPFFYAAVMAGYSREGLDWIEAAKKHIYRQYETIRKRLEEKMPMLSISPLEGGYIAWMDFRALRLSDEELAGMLSEAGIVADPGIEYNPGGSGFMRLNIATTSAWTEAFLSRLYQVLLLKGLLE